MKHIFKQLQDYYDQGDLWTDTLPNFPGGGTQFGIVFPNLAKAVAFNDAFRLDPFRYTPTGESQIVLRITPPRNEDEKQKGRLATNLYKALDVGDARGTLRTVYPKMKPTTILINTVRPSGRLEQVARMEVDTTRSDYKAVSVHLHSFYAGRGDISESVKKLIGIDPVIEGSGGDASMS